MHDKVISPSTASSGVQEHSKSEYSVISRGESADSALASKCLEIVWNREMPDVEACNWIVIFKQFLSERFDCLFSFTPDAVNRIANCAVMHSWPLYRKAKTEKALKKSDNKEIFSCSAFAFKLCVNCVGNVIKSPIFSEKEGFKLLTPEIREN